MNKVGYSKSMNGFAKALGYFINSYEEKKKDLLEVTFDGPGEEEGPNRMNLLPKPKGYKRKLVKIPKGKSKYTGPKEVYLE